MVDGQTLAIVTALGLVVLALVVAACRVWTGRRFEETQKANDARFDALQNQLAHYARGKPLDQSLIDVEKATTDDRNAIEAALAKDRAAGVRDGSR